MSNDDVIIILSVINMNSHLPVNTTVSISSNLLSWSTHASVETRMTVSPGMILVEKKQCFTLESLEAHTCVLQSSCFVQNSPSFAASVDLEKKTLKAIKISIDLIVFEGQATDKKL